MGMFPLQNPGRFSRGKPAATELRYPTVHNYLPSVCTICVCDHTTVRPNLFRQMDTGSLTYAHINVGACRAHVEGSGTNKAAQERVDSQGQIKKLRSPCPARGSNPGYSDLNSDALTTEPRLPSAHTS